MPLQVKIWHVPDSREVQIDNEIDNEIKYLAPIQKHNRKVY